MQVNHTMTQLRTELYETQLALLRLRRSVAAIKEAYDWWCEDQYDRDQRVVYDAIEEACREHNINPVSGCP